MNRKAGRILTTHGGSLPRPDEIVRLLHRKQAGEEFDEAEFEAVAQRAVTEAVARQRDAGVDLISDGELAKPGFVNYISDRLSGFGGESPFPPMGDLAEFPEYAAELYERRGAKMHLPRCIGPVGASDTNAVQRDVGRLRTALEGVEIVEAFLPSAAPGVIVQDFENDYYPTRDDYLHAVADAMSIEYRAIVDAGFMLQLDAPDLAMSRHVQYLDLSLEDYRRTIRENVDALNGALAGIPSDRVRLHVCWGNYPGPHHLDVALADILDIVADVAADGLYIEAANPRHQHEWAVFENMRLPDDKYLIVGVIDTMTNHIEHPELVAQRLVQYARLVGRDNVVAATDCGFATFAGVGAVHPTVAWAKLRALADGAEIASDKLW